MVLMKTEILALEALIQVGTTEKGTPVAIDLKRFLSLILIQLGLNA